MFKLLSQIKREAIRFYRTQFLRPLGKFVGRCEYPRDSNDENKA